MLHLLQCLGEGMWASEGMDILLELLQVGLVLHLLQ